MESETPNKNPNQKPKRKKTVTPRQLAANRANAQKSTGPKTLQGKLRSRYNSLTHGLTSNCTCIPSEDFQRYDFRRHDYSAMFSGANIFESEIIDELCANRWRKERAVRYETALMTEAIARYHDEIQRQYPGLSAPVEAGIAFRMMAENSNALQLLDRYEARLTNTCIRTWKHLMEVQKNRPDTDDPAANPGPPTAFPFWPHKQGDEPIPNNEHKPSQPIETKDWSSEPNEPVLPNEPIQLTTDHRPLTTANEPIKSAVVSSDPLSEPCEKSVSDFEENGAWLAAHLERAARCRDGPVRRE